jgi:hypothetical protein
MAAAQKSEARPVLVRLRQQQVPRAEAAEGRLSVHPEVPWSLQPASPPLPAEQPATNSQSSEKQPTD